MKQRFPRPRMPGRANRIILRRTAVLMALFGVAMFLPLTAKLVQLQILQHEKLGRLAAENQTRKSAVPPARGTIYDRNMNVLAVSADVENVCIDPNELALSGQDTTAIAENLAQILHVDKTRICALMEDTSYRYQIVKRKVEQEEATAVRNYIARGDVTGVYLEPDTKRYYPAGTLASQVLGFVGSDNKGLDGLEAAWDETLTGTAGQIRTASGNYGASMPFHYETFDPGAEGFSLVLTIDETVQQMLEKQMRSAIARYDVQNGAFGVILDVNSGGILAMATLGGFDPNNYAEILDPGLRERLEVQYREALSAEGEERDRRMAEYNTAMAGARLAQWRNRVIADGYEPGSTFKTITLAAALEEGAVTLSDGFFCSGSTSVKGRSKPLHCWKSAGHGQQSTAEALQNSCNVAFANIGIRLGGEKLYDYVQRFGLTERTGVELYGEASGIFFDEATLANPDSYASLTSAAFGQTFKITPMQLVRAVAAVVNGGYLLEPHLVYQVLDADGNVLEQHDRTVVRQVISEDTSRTMCTLLESVVSEGTAKNAQIAGYRIGGKTGTSEKIDVFDENGNMVEDKIVSFVGVAPMDDPQIVVLVALDTPSRETGFYISGGQMGAPTVREVLSDVLPYLGILPDSGGDGASVPVPDLRGMSRQDAGKTLAETGFTARELGQEDAVTEQVPAPGTQIPGGSEILLYYGQMHPEERLPVPDVVGMDAEEANRMLIQHGFYIKIVGAAGNDSTIAAIGQRPAAGEEAQRGTVVEVEFSDLSARD